MRTKILKLLIPLMRWIAENVRKDDPAFYNECLELITKAERVAQNERPD